MAQKRFYLIKRHDRLTLDETTGKYKPTFYVRFRGEGGGLLPWQSTHETSTTCAKLWAQRKTVIAVARCPMNCSAPLSDTLMSA